MNPIIYYILSAILSAVVLVGLSMQSKVKSAVQGNLLSVMAMAAAVIITLIQAKGLLSVWLWVAMAVGASCGILWARKIQMIEMPQMVGALNGIGGLASALVGGIELLKTGSSVFGNVTACLALIIGLITFSGSTIAALKLARKISSAPVIIKGYGTVSILLGVLMIAACVLAGIGKPDLALVLSLAALFFGVLFALRVGGADMPVAISLLNSLSGVAGAVAGMAVYNILLVAIGGIVGSSGLLLTTFMCRAMNRRLIDVLLGKTTKQTEKTPEISVEEPVEEAAPEPVREPETAEAVAEEPVPEQEETMTLKGAENVIIVPGYGMALSQAQHKVRELRDVLIRQGASVRFAIHPVAGRMPGHMNVLLAEADIDYDELCELDMINDDFKSADAVVVIGANDVLNPAAREAEGTPIYGMPILNVDQASRVFICNFDLNPGYAGVENPLYTRENGVRLLLGDAKGSLDILINELKA
ncbi:MAG: NAD(P)(+) transhydrogenase (Re/Si-specific) subunit beta [Firmicutes bacterium]|nr:NAD(P)(+) transhydrogenase (Re/Si-specific) subunit beta [Bacillota bacterium]